MVTLRRAIYTASLLTAASLTAAGCGKPAPPPEGAPQGATAPTVDMGTESGPQDTKAGSTDSPPDAGAPPAEQGETK
jgi:hypothetical protein